MQIKEGTLQRLISFKWWNLAGTEFQTGFLNNKDKNMYGLKKSFWKNVFTAELDRHRGKLEGPSIEVNMGIEGIDKNEPIWA